jgi:hypothetical protein
LVCFETNNEREYARKLKNKNADMIAMNSLNDKEPVSVPIQIKSPSLISGGKELIMSLRQKEAAKNIVDTIIQLYYA